MGPASILEASLQLDYWDFEFGDIRGKGIHWDGPQDEVKTKSHKYKNLAQRVMNSWSEIDPWSELEAIPVLSEENKKELAAVNQASQELNDWLYKKTLAVLNAPQKAKVGIIGGDHSSPLGSIKAHCEKYPQMGLLHIDAHADLRKSYQGFKGSHASIMRNVMELEKAPSILTQVGVRDYCEEEFNYICQRKDIQCFFDRDIKSQLFSNTHWDDICHSIIQTLPDKVYISLDIDGLSPEFCPHTGTPVPGGLSYDQTIHLLSVLRKSHKTVIGFDLCEVAPAGKEERVGTDENDEDDESDKSDANNGSNGSDASNDINEFNQRKSAREWDANVGARILYQLCGLVLQPSSTEGFRHTKK